MGRACLWVAPLLATAALACGTPPTGDASTSQASWRIDSAPFFDIGSREDDTLTILGRPHSVAMVEESLVVIGDYSYHNIRYFNRSGELVRTVGRRGEGPGEFQVVSRILRCGDSLHVLDGQRQQWAVYSAAGSLARTYTTVAPSRAQFSGASRMQCNAAGGFINHAAAAPDVEVPTKVRPVVPFWLSDPDGRIANDLGDFPGPELLAKFFRTTRYFPLGRVTVIAIGADRAYVGLADTSAILTYRLDGTLISAIETPFVPRATREADREFYRLLDTVGQDSLGVRGALRRWETFEFPETVPAYTALIVDSNDLLWVRGSPQDSSHTVRWSAMTETGQLVGSVDLPVALEVAEIGIDYVLGIETDLVDGSQRVRAYRLRR